MYDQGKHDRERIEQLKALATQLERLPPSRARDLLLREAHHRTVMLDTGEPPTSPWRDGLGDDRVALFQHMTIPASRGVR